MRSTGHGLHLIAAHRALAKQLEEIERTALLGRAPGSGGPVLTPLPPELWEPLGAALTRIGDRSEAIARRNAPDSRREPEVRQPLGATLRWIDLLLRRLEESLAELDPENITRKFGPFREETEAEQM